MKNTADATDGKPIAVWMQSISGVNAINPLVAFYDIHGRMRKVLLLDDNFDILKCQWIIIITLYKTKSLAQFVRMYDLKNFLTDFDAAF
jgi:hypothetical protein